MGQCIHSMLTVAVAIYGQPDPSIRTGALYEQFSAYQRVGRWIATGGV